MTSTHRFAAVTLGLAATAMLTVSGCSGDPAPKPSHTTGPGSPSATATSPSSETSSDPVLKDRSDAVLGAQRPTSIGRANGFLRASVGDPKVDAPAMADILSVVATPTATVLTWQLSTKDKINTGNTLNALEAINSGFPDRVQLADVGANKAYGPLTTKQGKYNYCACNESAVLLGPDPIIMSAEYPALPASLTKVQVRIPHFKPVTVPVTRKS